MNVLKEVVVVLGMHTNLNALGFYSVKMDLCALVILSYNGVLCIILRTTSKDVEVLNCM